MTVPDDLSMKISLILAIEIFMSSLNSCSVELSMKTVLLSMSQVRSHKDRFSLDFAHFFKITHSLDQCCV